ncbi:phosphatase PAP2 family protein [Hydrogenophaga sp. OTU3427]|uniref:phosphatase PAP2 family protein n=1 Tax=Hydrogenophaga sp. OTU3427 TaxID=3043856 RepID=UPI00313AB57C
MSELNLALFHAVNLSPTAPAWLLGLARFASLQLPALLVALALGGLVLPQKKWSRLAWDLVVGMALAWLGARLLQYGWHMPRPFVLGLGQQWIAHGSSPSFPSTHASVAVAFGALAWRRAPHAGAGWAALVLAALVAWSRIAVGVHVPLDVAAGVLVGLAATVFVLRLRPRTGNLQPVPPPRPENVAPL